MREERKQEKIDTIKYHIIQLKFTYETRILPQYVTNHKNIYYEKINKTNKKK